jgi:hypothetical protein
LSENEPINKLSLKNDFVNNYVQAKFIAIRRILQGREDLIINLQTDYSGIQVEAGDVIRVTNETYGWTDKLFRISNVIEEKDADGNLFAKLTGFEYNASIYDDDLDITDFIPADNTGLQDPNIITVPDTPIVVANVDTTLNFLDISANVPNSGLTLNLDFNYGFDSNTANHLYYTTVNYSNGAPLIPDSNYTINVNDIEQSGNIFWSTTARNRSVGVQSLCSAAVLWPGANVSLFDPGSNTGGIQGNNIQSNTVTSNNMTTTGVVVGNYTNANISIDAAGRITTAANGVAGITVEDEGIITVNNASILNFVGNAVTVTNVANTEATITINTSGGGPGAFDYESSGSFDAYTATFFPFVNAANSVYRNQSMRIPGLTAMANVANTWTAVSYTQGSGDWDPWFQNTATTANGFLANSTALCAPQGAQYQSVSVKVPAGWFDGGQGWFVIGSSQVSGGAAETDQFRYTGTFNVVSNVDCDIQIGGATYFTTDLLQTLGYYLDWATVQTIPLIANRPQTITSTFHSRGSSIDPDWNIFQMGAALKNPNSSANVWVTTGAWLIEDPGTAFNSGNGWVY